MQWACQFQYDAWPLAPTNVNWQTHWLSLPYTPSKAISFAIAAETFRQLPRGQAADGDRFGPTTVSYEEDRSELVTETTFAHSNSTTTKPPNPAALEHLYGVGSSPVVQYDGTGAWFLDRLEPGAWRLEVYPDVVVLDNPFARPNLEREVARLVWRQRSMTIHLPDLTSDFVSEPLHDGNGRRTEATGAKFTVAPGVYRPTRRGGPRPAMEPGYFAPEPDPSLPLRAAHLAPDASSPAPTSPSR
ncbi:MAG: hypothetical protein M5U09_19065 [Gammaproteobacteria bacterium]|nr:hypothetical protein [Gammaproteobacteria bacterium]